MLLKQLLELNLFPSLFTRPEEDPTPSLLQISFIHRHLSLSTFSFGCLSSIFPRDLLFLFVSSLSPPLFSLSLPLSSLSGEKKKETPGRPIGGESWRRNGGWIFYHFCFGATEMGKRGVLIYIYTYIEGLDSGTRLNGFARTVRPSVFKIRIRCIKILREMKEERRVKNSLCSKRKKIVVVEWEIVFCVKKIKEKYVASKGKWQQI